MTESLTNWAGNVRFAAVRLHRPESVAELQALVAGSERLRALGSAHSFNAIADTTGDLVAMAAMPGLIELDSERRQVRVAAAVTYGELAGYLQPRGYALGNLGSLPHISVAGACATATHGSGDSIGNLATAVCGIELVTAEGDLVTLSRQTGGGLLNGAVVALGTLGIVTAITLDVVPTFNVRQYVYLDLPRSELDAHLAEIFAAGYSVSLFTDWRDGPDGPVGQVWVKKLVTQDDPADAPPHWHGAILAATAMHPVRGMSADNTTAQLGVPGPWHQRLPHFRPDARPSTASELQTEYLLPRSQASAAIDAVGQVSAQLTAVLQVSELRTVAADELWLSPSYQRDTLAMHFTWTADLTAVTAAIAVVERQLAPLQPRPHWGKLSGLGPAAVRGSYPRLADFRELMLSYDPAGKFGNEFTSAYLGSG